MKAGDRYNCFIKLFGEIENEGNQEAVKCKIISNEMIGCKEFLKVSVDKECFSIRLYT